MKLVTYEAGEGPRVGRLDDDGVVDVGFDDDMIAFIEAGADIIHVSTGQTSVDAQPVYGRMYQTPFSDQIRNEARMPNFSPRTPTMYGPSIPPQSAVASAAPIAVPDNAAYRVAMKPSNVGNIPAKPTPRRKPPAAAVPAPFATSSIAAPANAMARLA